VQNLLVKFVLDMVIKKEDYDTVGETMGTHTVCRHGAIVALRTCLFGRLTCNNVGNKIVYYKYTVQCQHLQFWPEGRGQCVVMVQSWSHIRGVKAAGSLCMWENARKLTHPASWK